MIKKNKKYIEILQEKTLKKSEICLTIDNFQEILKPNFLDVNDTIILGKAHEESEAYREYYDESLKIYKEKTAYEINFNDIYFSNYFENELSLKEQCILGEMIVRHWLKLLN